MASVASSTPDPRHLQLIAASAQANETRVREILAEESVWSTRHDQDALRQSLQKVAARGNLTVTRLLLEKGADVEPRRESEMPALFKAAEAGHFAVVQELLQHRANPNVVVRSRLGQTALFPACFRGHNKVVGLLLDHGADVRIRDKEGRTPLLYLASEKEKVKWTMDTLRLLIDRGGANVEVRDNIGRTPLLWAATNGNLQLVEALLNGSLGGAAAADVSASNNRGRSALHLAAEANHEAMVRLLLKHKADPNASSDGGWTPLHNAVQNGHAGVVALLLAEDANVNAELSNGMTPLHWAAFNGFEAVVKLLLARDETKLDVKDSFDRTPMLCAAERFHRDIVQLLSPVHAAQRLSPTARAACQEFKATVVDFGSFRDGKQHQVFKRSVFDVLYGWDEENGKPKVDTQIKNVKYQPDFRWIHLPANNIAWVETLLSKWFIEGGHRDIEPFKALEKCFDQEHRGPLAHAHFMRTFCHRIPSLHGHGPAPANDKDAKQPFPPLSEEPTDASVASTNMSASTNLSKVSSATTMTMTSTDGTTTPTPKKSGTADAGEGSSGTPRSDKKKSKGELIAERHPRRAKRASGPPGNPPGTKAMKAAAAARSAGLAPAAWDASKLPALNGKVVLFMPFLHYETDERRQRMTHAINLVRDGWDPPVGSPRDIMLTKGYLCNTPPLHPRRTLDQFFYHGIDTSIRDTDQVVYRYCKRHNIEKKVFMVDQLWLWVLGKDLVITCFPQRWDQPARDPLNVVDGIIEETNAKTRPPIQSVYDLAMLITNRCSGMFDRYRLADQDYQFLDMFESSIGLVTNTESELFSRFNKASELSAEWLELHRRPSRRRVGGLASSLQSSPSQPSLVPTDASGDGRLHATVPVFPDALLDIGTETSLLAEIKDIRDELNILAVVLASQKATLDEFENHLTEELRPEGTATGRRANSNNYASGTGTSGGVPTAAGYAAPVTVDSIVNEIRKRSRDQRRLLEIHQKDIDRMDRQAESIYLSLTNLLDLKQKHSNALEARFGRDHAVIAARQGQTIMAFTIVTIIFLPMSFISSFFSMQITDWSTELSLSYVSKYLFGIGLGISIPLVIMAFTVSDIYDAVHNVMDALHVQRARGHRKAPHNKRPGGLGADGHPGADLVSLAGKGKGDSDMESLATIEKAKRSLLMGSRGANHSRDGRGGSSGGGGGGGGGLFGHGGAPGAGRKSRSWSIGGGASGGRPAIRSGGPLADDDRDGMSGAHSHDPSHNPSHGRYESTDDGQQQLHDLRRLSSHQRQLNALHPHPHQHQLLHPPAWAVAAGTGGGSGGGLVPRGGGGGGPGSVAAMSGGSGGGGGVGVGGDGLHERKYSAGSSAGRGWRASLERTRDLEKGK
ncbi:hypothetical protein HMPREF1624_05282 [Sporothrix schenckii ATCC 58251]|uniref:Uncharacterized protein n=1 Tax=Sporothrix schenckii (strain ATCC 58251 / de Perez 2211183) TaxID=1391915 RepID=U7PS92_SPOS1|nr:hypothetical protein HMPREF1624_05282 [Sporothrix schenckii ATCC 58251]